MRLRRDVTTVVMTLASLIAALTTGQLATAFGVVQDDEVQVLTQDIRVRQDPTMVVTPAGTSIALWVQGTDRVMTARLPANGQTWTSPQLITNDAFYATIATRGFNGAVVGWQSHELDGASISARSLRGDGTLGPISQVARWQESGGITVSLQVASNAHGDMVAVWTRGSRVRASYHPAGGDWTPRHVFPDTNAYALNAVANVSPSGEADVLFPASIKGAKGNLVAYHRNNDGQWQGQMIGEFANARHLFGTSFSAAINRDGDIAVAWMNRPPDKPWRVYARYQPAGDAFGTIDQVSRQAVNPRIAVDGSGVAGLTYLGRHDVQVATMFTRRSLAGVWSSAEEVSTVGEADLRFAQIGIEANAGGTFVVHTQGVHQSTQGSTVADHRMVWCFEEEVCGEARRVKGPRSFRGISYGVHDTGKVVVVWGVGCATEECIPTSVQAKQLLPG